MVFFGGCHFDFSRPGRPPYRGSGTVSPPCFRLRARLVTPVSGSWRATTCAPVAARFVGVGPRPLAFSARVFGMSAQRTLTRVDESQIERTLVACEQALAARGQARSARARLLARRRSGEAARRSRRALRVAHRGHRSRGIPPSRASRLPGHARRHRARRRRSSAACCCWRSRSAPGTRGASFSSLPRWALSTLRRTAWRTSPSERSWASASRTGSSISRGTPGPVSRSITRPTFARHPDSGRGCMPPARSSPSSCRSSSRSTRSRSTPRCGRSLLILAFGLFQIAFDVLFSVKISDWKKFRREMRLAR